MILNEHLRLIKSASIQRYFCKRES